MEKASVAVFACQFTHVPSFNVWPEINLCAPNEKKVCHSFELPSVFGNPTTVTRQAEPPGYRFSSDERVLSERIAGYWISFAESKDPNHAEAPAWPGFTAAAPIRQILNTPITHLSDLDANCGFSDSVGYNVDSLSRVRGEFGG